MLKYAFFDNMKSFFDNNIIEPLTKAQKKRQNAKYNNWKKEANAKDDRRRKRDNDKYNRWKKRQNAKHNNWKKGQRYKGACGRFIKRYDEKVKQVRDRDNIIKLRDATISDLNIFKDSCIKTNDRLITKNNALLDSTQYVNDQNYGYRAALVRSKLNTDEIVNQRIGQTIRPVEGFSIFDRIDNENTVIQNQINTNTQQHSVDDQKYRNLNNQIEFLKKANEILGWILFAVIIICALVIWGSNESLVHKLVVIKVVWLYLIFVEILEYVLFYVYRYMNALLFGEPYNSADFWKFPHLSWLDIGIIILIVLSVFI